MKYRYRCRDDEHENVDEHVDENVMKKKK